MSTDVLPSAAGPVAGRRKTRCRSMRTMLAAVVFPLAVILLAGCGKAEKADKFARTESAAPRVESAPADSAPLPSTTHGQRDFVEGAAPDMIGDEPEGAAPAPAPKSTAPPSAASRKANTITHVRVFYGTDRKRTGSSDPNNFYSGRRAKLSLGFCDVSMPPGHQRGELESPSIWRFEFSENPQKHVMLRSVEPVEGRRFVSELRKQIEDSIETVSINGREQQIGGEAFVFVHGYNVTFKDAARRTAQMAHDLEFRGAPVMFSWPSQGQIGLASYRDDGRSAQWCEEHVMDFVTGIARHSGARRLHLIAHSMGNRIVTNVLRRLAYNPGGEDLPGFNQVILTAPDIDARVFKESVAPRIVQAAERITIYASSQDVALKASSLVNSHGDARLGQAGEDLTFFPEYPNIDVIDASSVDTSLFAFKHSYFADSPTVLDDIYEVLAGVRPERRRLSTLVKSVAWKIRAGADRISRGAVSGRR